MRREVLLTEDAQLDLEGIYDYITEFDSPRNADQVLERLLELVGRLAAFPEKGSQPKELRSLGIHEYRLSWRLHSG